MLSRNWFSSKLTFSIFTWHLSALAKGSADSKLRHARKAQLQHGESRSWLGEDYTIEDSTPVTSERGSADNTGAAVVYNT